MEIILTHSVKKLGNIGDVVNVKNGYARNYLIPKGFGIRATEEAKEAFEARKQEIITLYDEAKQKAEKLLEFVPQSVNLIRQASDDSRLFGSVSSRDIVSAVNESVEELEITKNMIDLSEVIKYLGIYEVEINLHPEVEAKILVNIARSEDEAKIALDKKLKNNNTANEEIKAE